MADFIRPAVHGTLCVLRAASKAGIKRVVVTSSFAAVTDFNKGGVCVFNPLWYLKLTRYIS